VQKKVKWNGNGNGNGKRGKSARGGGEDVCPTTAGFTIGQLVLFFSFSVFPLLSLSAGGACCLVLGARCLGVNRII